MVCPKVPCEENYEKWASKKNSIFLNHIDKLIEAKFANVNVTFCFP